jgi:hypothetical protein
MLHFSVFTIACKRLYKRVGACDLNGEIYICVTITWSMPGGEVGVEGRREGRGRVQGEGAAPLSDHKT